MSKADACYFCNINDNVYVGWNWEGLNASLEYVEINNNISTLNLDYYVTGANEPTKITHFGASIFLKQYTDITNINLPASLYFIPQSWLQIQDSPLIAIPNLLNYTVSGNINGSTDGYNVVNGVLYENKDNSLRSYPCGRTLNGKFPYDVFISGCKKIGETAFLNFKFEKIVIPEQITEIAYNAFWGCNIDSITIPKSVTKIDSNAFISIGKEIGRVGKVYCYKGSVADNVKLYNKETEILYIGESKSRYYYIKSNFKLQKADLYMKRATEIVECSLFIKGGN